MGKAWKSLEAKKSEVLGREGTAFSRFREDSVRQ